MCMPKLVTLSIDGSLELRCTFAPQRNCVIDGKHSSVKLHSVRPTQRRGTDGRRTPSPTDYKSAGFVSLRRGEKDSFGVWTKRTGPCCCCHRRNHKGLSHLLLFRPFLLGQTLLRDFPVISLFLGQHKVNEEQNKNNHYGEWVNQSLMAGGDPACGCRCRQAVSALWLARNFTPVSHGVAREFVGSHRCVTNEETSARATGRTTFKLLAG